MHANESELDLATNDLGPLAWVLDELRKSLESASGALRRFVRDAGLARGTDMASVDAGQLRIARQQLHQSVGALEMVGLSAPAQLLRAMETAVQKFVERPELCNDVASAKVERAGFALTEYLEGLLLGKSTSSVALFPQYRDVQELAGAERTHPADLWSFDWSWIEPQTPATAQVLTYDPAVRSRLDQSVLKVIKSGDTPAAGDLAQTCLSLAAGQTARQPKIFWKICAGYFEALSLGMLPTDNYVKRAASRILMQYATLAKGELGVSDRLATDLVFFCAQAVPASAATAPLLASVRTAYRLQRFVPVDYTVAYFGRFDPALLMQARKRITVVKESWSSLSGGDASKLKSVPDQFQHVSDVLVKLHPPSAPLAQSLQATIDTVVRSGQAPRTEVAMEVATAVLYLEAAFQELDPTDNQLVTRTARLAQRLESVRQGGQPEPLEGWMEELYRRVSDRQTMGSVVGELRGTLSELEKLLDAYFRSPQDKTPLKGAPGLLTQMRGVLSVLGLEQASQAVLRMRGALETMIVSDVDEYKALHPTAFDQLGNNLGALGFLIDMLNYQPTLAKKLFVYDDAAGELRPLMGRTSISAHDDALEPDAAEPVASAAVADVRGALAGAASAVPVAATPPFATTTPAPAEPQPATASAPVTSPVEARPAPAEVPLPSFEFADVPPANADASPGVTAPPASASPAPSLSPVQDVIAASAAAAAAPAEDDGDAELREIFLEEAREVVQTGQAAVQALIGNPGDIGELTTLRRAFHTLKGSSRMVGLNEFGEAGWAFEQVLNTWLADQKHASEPLCTLTSTALAGFGRWIEDIAARTDTAWKSGMFRAPADAFRTDGRLEPFAFPSAGVDAAAGIGGPVSDALPELADPSTGAAADLLPSQPEAHQADTLPEPGATTSTPDFELDFPEPVAQPIPELLPTVAEASTDGAGADAFDLDFDLSPADASAVTAVEAPADDELLQLFDALQAPAGAAVPEPATAAAAAAVIGSGAGSAVPPLAIPAIDLAFDATHIIRAEPVAAAELVATASASAEPPPEAAAFDFELASSGSESSPLAAPASSVGSVDFDSLSAMLAPPADAQPEPHIESTAATPDASTTGLLDAAAPAPIAQDLPRSSEETSRPHASAEASLALDVFEGLSGPAMESALHMASERNSAASGAPQSPVVMAPPDLEQSARPLEAAGASDEHLATADSSVADAGSAATPDVAGALEPGGAPHLAMDGTFPAEPEAPAEALSSAIDEQVKVIGTLRIGIPLYNVYLNEADEWSRRLATEVGEWSLELNRPLPDSAVGLAHALAGSSATVGFHALSDIARALESALAHTQTLAYGTPQHGAAFTHAAEDIRRLLHQFAAGFLKEPDPRTLQALAALHGLDIPKRDDFRESNPFGLDEIDLAADDVHSDGASGATPGTIETIDAIGTLEAEPLGAPDPSEPVASSPAEDARPWGPPAAFVQPVAADVRARPLSLNEDEDDIDAIDAVDPDLFPIFEEEAIELMPQLGAALRQWAQQPDDRQGRDESLRVLHTLKGSARLAGALRLGEMAHRLETEIEHLGSEGVNAADVETLLTRFDHMQASFDALRAGEALTGAADVPSGAEPGRVVPALQDESAPDAAAAPALFGTSEPEPTTGRALLARPVATQMLPQRAAANQAVRVRSQLLDRLVNQAGEVMITRSRLEVEMRQLRSSLSDLTGNLDRLRTQLRDIELQAETQMQSRLAQAKDSAAGFDPLEFDRFTRVQELTRMMAESVNDVATVQRNLQRTVEATEDDLIAQARQTRELQRDLLRTRMVEFEGISDRLYRVVRLASKETGKQVKLDITGGSIEMDRGVLDRMTPAFEHLLRNCVAHGIEAPSVRAAAGKDPVGTILIGLAQEGNDVSVEFRDDGAGLDLARIREKALQQGLVTAGQEISEAEAANLIFMPGFSTAAQVTELAGRGIGMDVVRSEVNALGGRIETQTQLGRGTSFKLVLPLTTAVTQVVMVRSGGLSIGVPATMIEIVRRASAKDVQQAYNAGTFEFAGEALPFYWSGALLQSSQRSSEPQSKTLPIVIFRSAAQRVAVHVDEVLGSQEVVVKNLGPQLSRLPGLAGMTVLASGAVVLIYNPVALSAVYGEQARQLSADHAQPEVLGDAAVAPARPAVTLAAAVPQVPLVLVVDDSITVRRVTQRLLQREGYRVSMAADGLQALERLAEERPTVVLSDIEMPRMDGFDLARNIRADARLADLPIVMITSRIAEKHREHAMELGVNHYLGKPYSEEELLSLVRHYSRAGIAA